jgi:parvulin-like peptidyl-prolyl isomerase
VEKLKKMEEEKIIVNAMRSREVKGEPLIPESKIQAFYNEHRSEWTANDEVKLRMIKISGGDDAAKKREMTREIRDKINRGSDFADLARIYSDDSTQDKGGDWGWKKRGELNPALEQVVFSLSKGKVSEITEFDRSFYLLLAEDRKEGVSKPLKEVRGDIEKHLMQVEKQKLQQVWLEKLRKKAYIKIY